MRGYNQNVQRDIYVVHAAYKFRSLVSGPSFPRSSHLSNIHKIEAPPPSKVKLWQQRVGTGGIYCLEVVRRPWS